MEEDQDPFAGLPADVHADVLARLSVSALTRYRVAALASKHTDASQLDAIVELARSGDPVAADLLDRYIDRVARSLATIVNALDPDIFVIGGGMSNVQELYDQLPTRIPEYTFTTVFTTPIVRSAHGDSTGVRGAAWLWAEDAQ